MIKLLKRLSHRVSTDGLIIVAQKITHLVEDLYFDKKYNTDTVRWRSINEVSHKHTVNASPYQPTRGTPFLKLLHKLKLPKSFTFVDIGSGKGKILLLAQEYGFKNIKGVEFSTELCQIAEKNILEYSKKKKGYNIQPIDVINDDILNYQFTRDSYCLFLFNPFDEIIMSKLIEKLKVALNKKIKMIIIYRNPKYASLFSDSLHLYEYEEIISGDDYIVFSTYGLKK